MLYSVVICTAYIIGIIWGLYLDLCLGIILFFLLFCLWFILRLILFEKKSIKIYKYIAQEDYFVFNNKLATKVFVLIFFSFLIGFLNTHIRLNDFENKYNSRNFF